MRNVCELYLIRHGFAEERGPAWPDDNKRPLTDHGISRLRRAGRALARLGLTPDVVLTSPLVRARQTAEIVARELGLASTALHFRDNLYNASASTLARELHQRPAGALVLLVAHNPGISALARQWSEEKDRLPFPPAGWESFLVPADG